MVTTQKFIDLALDLDGTVEAPHFERTAFKVKRIFVTLAGDGKTANFKFTPDEQEQKCLMYPDVFSPVANKFGAQGWTVADLKKIKVAELKAALKTAHAHAGPRKT